MLDPEDRKRMQALLDRRRSIERKILFETATLTAITAVHVDALVRRSNEDGGLLGQILSLADRPSLDASKISDLLEGMRQLVAEEDALCDELGLRKEAK